MKQEGEKGEGPFEKKGRQNATGANTQRYVKTGETFKLHIHKIRKEWCEGQMEKEIYRTSAKSVRGISVERNRG